ncbi:DsbA family protein [Geminicoccaceae bacterium 1502E]|nr:DsbA family protein [Geminicoccaceae bacterium 1502E]
MLKGSKLTRRTALALATAALALPSLKSRAAEVTERVIGEPDAPVTIIEYASLTCPHCASFHRDVLPGLKERYIDTGKVKLVFRDFPLDQVALRAAVVAHCGGPARYGQFLDVLFENQERWAHAEDPVAALKQIASLAGLSGEQVDACLADEQMIDAVLQSRLDAQQEYDVRSTPTFVIDGKVYPGGRDVEAFAEIIEPLLR